MSTSMLPTQIISLAPLSEREYNEIISTLTVGREFLLYVYGFLYHGPKLYRVVLTGLNPEGDPVCNFTPIYYDDGSWHTSPPQSKVWPEKPSHHRAMSELEYDLLPETNYTHRMCKRAIIAWRENDARRQAHAAEKKVFMDVFKAMKIELPKGSEERKE